MNYKGLEQARGMSGGWPLVISAPRVQEYRLRAELRRMRERGEIAPEYRLEQRGDRVVAHTVRLREPASRVPWYMAGAAMAMGALAGVSWLVWESRYVIMWAALGALGLYFALKTAAGHSAACLGIHCSGCRG